MNYKIQVHSVQFIIIILFCSVSLISVSRGETLEQLPVSVKTLQQLVFHPVKKVPAQVVSLQSSLLSAEISALVTNVHVQVGDKVIKDQLLITLECDDYRLSKQQLMAKKKALDADYDFAYYQYQHSKKLIKTKSVSQEAHRRQASDIQRFSAQKQLLQIQVKQADKNISRCTIQAPFNGVIAKRLISLGEHTTPHSPLIRLIDIENLEVEVQVPIALIDKLDYSALNFMYRNQAYPLKLRAIIPSIETRARHQRVRLSFLDQKTLPDAYGMVEITFAQQVIPANYLVTRSQKIGLFLVKKISSEDAKSQLIADFHILKDALPGRVAKVDLPLDSQVIIAGREALSNGQNITIKNK